MIYYNNSSFFSLFLYPQEEMAEKYSSSENNDLNASEEASLDSLLGGLGIARRGGAEKVQDVFASTKKQVDRVLEFVDKGYDREKEYWNVFDVMADSGIDEERDEHLYDRHYREIKYKDTGENIGVHVYTIEDALNPHTLVEYNIGEGKDYQVMTALQKESNDLMEEMGAGKRYNMAETNVFDVLVKEYFNTEKGVHNAWQFVEQGGKIYEDYSQDMLVFIKDRKTIIVPKRGKDLF